MGLSETELLFVVRVVFEMKQGYMLSVYTLNMNFI